MVHYITSRDYLFLLLYMPILIVLFFLISNQKEKELQSLYRLGFFLKLLSCILLGTLFEYYYNTGDTLSFFRHSVFLTNQYIDNPLNFFKYFFSTEEEFVSFFKEYVNRPIEVVEYFKSPNLFVIKVASICNLFSFNSYFITAFFFCYFAYEGLWRIFIYFYNKYPQIGKKFAIMLFFPSIVFFSSGILKDAICLGAMGFLFHYFVSKNSTFMKLLLHGIAILFFGWIIFSIKSYIIYCLIVPLLLWKIQKIIIYFNTVLSKKKLLFLFLITIIIGSSFFVKYYSLFSFDKELLAKEIIRTRIGFLNAFDNEGSFFDLGEFEPNLFGFTTQAIKGINASLFRPYLWEAKNILVAISGFENLLLGIVCIIVFFKTNAKTFLNCLLTNPDFSFSICFSLVFALFLGLVIPSFGALIRFRIQYLPFFICALYLAYYHKSIENTVSLRV